MVATIESRFSLRLPPTGLLHRELSKPHSVGAEGATIRKLAEQVMAQHSELNELREALAAGAVDFEYLQPEPHRSSSVNVIFMPGVIAAPPPYDFDE